LVAAPGTAVRASSDFFVSQSALNRENEQLKAQRLRDAERLLRFSQVEAENAHLRSLLTMREKLPVRSMTAEIIAATRDPFVRKVTVDKGAVAGVTQGQAVVDAAGVIGQITRVLPFSSEVTLVTDRDQAIPVMVVRNGMRAIAFGGSDPGTIEVRFLAANAEIEVGDILVTSGLDDIYIAGLPVARVNKVERTASAAFALVSCTPLGGVDRYGQVLLVGAPDGAKPAPPANQSAQPHGKR
jgi:rod shape-determining protein MreC